MRSKDFFEGLYRLNEEGRDNFSNYSMCHDCPWHGGECYDTEGNYCPFSCDMGDHIDDADMKEADRLGVVLDCNILITEASEKGYLE